jgi:DNA helicase HerA-like ATPase
MKKDTLQISATLSLPLEAVTQTFGILGKRGAGKTNTAVVVAEEMIRAGLPNVIVDPVGVWWGLRSSKDGQRKGLPVYIFGGEQGDIPLEETAGQLVADFIVETRQPVVLDVSTFSKSAARRFMTDFAERLYRQNRQAQHLTIDEADTFIPQRVEHGAERLVGAINDIVRRGRARGLGVTLISQRPALIHNANRGPRRPPIDRPARPRRDRALGRASCRRAAGA